MAQKAHKRVEYIFTALVDTVPSTTAKRMVITCNGFYIGENNFMASEIKFDIRTNNATPFGIAPLSTNTEKRAYLAAMAEEAKVLPLQVGIGVDETTMSNWVSVTHGNEVHLDDPKLYKVSEGDSAPVLVLEL